MTGVPASGILAINVAAGPQRSPLRDPGGTTWLAPHISEWLKGGCRHLVEPFAGGGIVALTAIEQMAIISRAMVGRQLRNADLAR